MERHSQLESIRRACLKFVQIPWIHSEMSTTVQRDSLVQRQPLPMWKMVRGKRLEKSPPFRSLWAEILPRGCVRRSDHWQLDHHDVDHDDPPVNSSFEILFLHDGIQRIALIEIGAH